MCGIAALVTPEVRPAADTVARMVAALRHRGPDSQATHRFDRCTLGSARLSVVDVEGGKQPILSTDGSAGICFNGAIYGFRELKKELAPYPFKTDTDTEVILALHQRYGNRFLTYLPGMFAFALWDERSQTLTCARDRFGEKPLYYAHGPKGELIVASEIKSILASGLVEPTLSPQALSQYLMRLYVHPTQTIYANIHVLPPAHLLRWERGRIRVERYWRPPDVVEGIGMEDAVGRFRELLERSVERQLVADVPVGVLLSGGVDSSTVAAIASQRQPGVRTFSFGFKAGVESELPYARASAALYGTSHHERLDESLDLPGLLARMQEVYDEPFADSSNVPTFLICEEARRHVTVALGGDGADELLGGYMCWARHCLESHVPAQAEGVQPSAAWLRRLVRLFAPEAPVGSPLVRRYAGECRIYFTPAEQRSLGLAIEPRSPTDFSRYPRDRIDDLLRYDTDHYLPGDILVKTDRASMAHGLELRAPFLDVELASFCLSLPDTLKVDAQREKLLLRRAYGDRWIPEVKDRPKQGFGSPMAAWLKRPAMRDLKQALLGDRREPIFGLLDFDPVQAYAGQDDQKTWSLLILALWMRTRRCAPPKN